MTAPTPNAALAYAVLDHIDAHPETWRQSTWIAGAECGTVACFAGWAVQLSGLKPWLAPDQTSTSFVELADGKLMRIDTAAELLLGVDRYVNANFDDERDLFDLDNTREDLGRLVEEIFGLRPKSCGYLLAHPAHDWADLANDEHEDIDCHCPGLADDVPPNAGSAS